MAKNVIRSFASQTPRPALSVLRSAYVAARFADPDGLSIADPDRWLESERKTSALDLDAWNRLTSEADFTSATLNREVEILRRYADPVVFAGGRIESFSLTFSAMLHAFDPYRASVFMGFSLSPIVVFSGSKHAVRLEEDSETETVAFQTAESLDVCDALFMSWAKGGPHAERAREFLCDAAERAFIQLRAEYGHAFDESVAIAADGSSVICADRVLLYTETPTVAARAYPSVLCKAGKLDVAQLQKLPALEVPGTLHEFLVSHGGKRSDAEGLLLCARQTGTTQTLVITKADGKRLFVSRIDAAGLSALPPGGVTVV